MRSARRTGVAAILGGVLFFAGQGGQVIFGNVSSAVEVVYVLLVGAGIAALGVALWGLRQVAHTRRGRIGVRLALAGIGLLGLFAVQALIEQIRTGDVPSNFLLFALGFLLFMVGQLLFARDLRSRLGRAWLLPLVAVAGVLVAITLDVDPIHDIGLFVFEGAWVALGVLLLRG